MTDEREETIRDLDLPDDEAAHVEGGFRSVTGLKVDTDVVDFKEPANVEFPN
jgi:hypothetical protein